jgi:hypothetical protein
MLVHLARTGYLNTPPENRVPMHTLFRRVKKLYNAGKLNPDGTWKQPKVKARRREVVVSITEKEAS